MNKHPISFSRRLTAWLPGLLLASSLTLLWSGPSAAQSVEKKRAPAKPASSRVELRSKANQMAAGVAAAEAALAPEELAIAEHVHTGVMPCEMGAFVKLEGDPGMPGYFNMTGKNFRFRMVPVVSSTGAVRLEDRQAGAVWLQLANKSMLMNQKVGRRMADECMSPAQLNHAHHMKMNPSRGLLDGAEGAPAPEATLPLKASPAITFRPAS